MHRKQQLVLLRLKTVFFSGRLTEVKKSPDLPSELGQITVLGAGEILLSLHSCIVPRYNVRLQHKADAHRIEQGLNLRRGGTCSIAATSHSAPSHSRSALRHGG